MAPWKAEELSFMIFYEKRIHYNEISTLSSNMHFWYYTEK